MLHDWSSHTMDAFRYLTMIQSKRRNKGMTEEDANRIQAMDQVRFNQILDVRAYNLGLYDA